MKMEPDRTNDLYSGLQRVFDCSQTTEASECSAG